MPVPREEKESESPKSSRIAPIRILLLSRWW